MHKKLPKICIGVRVIAAKIYLYHNTKIAKARPHRVKWQTDSSVQKQWFMTKDYYNFSSPLVSPSHLVTPLKFTQRYENVQK